MAFDILLPLSVELLGESFVRLEAGFDFFLAFMVVGQSGINLGKVQIGILLQDFLGCMPLLVHPHDVGYPDASAVDACLTVSDLGVFGDVGVNGFGRRGCHDSPIIPVLRKNSIPTDITGTIEPRDFMLPA